MVPSNKRKAVDDDFILTISDNEADVIEDEVEQPAPPKKKTKVDKKKNKKNKNKQDEEEEQVEEEVDGVWGRKDEDDGAMDSDFEFMADANNAVEPDAEFEGWGFDGAKKGMKQNENKGVDLDEIIRRRKAKKEGKVDGGDTKKDEAPTAPADGEDDEDDEELEGLELDDDDDGVLAEDGFGMGVGSDVNESDDESMKDGEDESDDEGSLDEDEDDDAASDNDSVATPVQHPEDDERSDSDEEEDAEEAAKREAFFAPEEKEPAGKKAAQSSFQALSLSRPILRGLATVGFTKPTPIQSKAIPIALMGKDVVGGAVTGSGKTAAFVVPILERLLYRPKKVPTTRVVILMPTRELAIQCHAVATKLASHTDIKFCLAVGGLSLKVQEAELRLRPDVVIATPGRFIDHMRNSPSFTIETTEILVLDEADRMLEDGFADELNEILTSMPKSRQTMLFSATMTSSVDRLIRVGMNKPVRVMVDSQKGKTVTTLVQEFVRLRPGREEKRLGYLAYLCKNLYTERVIIFFRQKKIAHRTRIIFGLLGLSCAELHGSMSQEQRIASVEAFRDGKVSFLLATDLASRGLDIKGIDTVINFEAPQSLDIYVHRVGRTARAGRTGTAVTLAAEPDRKVVKAAVKAGKASGAKISSRIIPADEADKLQEQIDDMEDDIEVIMEEEKEEKQLAQAEMQVKKGENMIRHEEEIAARPKRTWFETQADKKAAKDAGRAELNGIREKMKKKGAGQLSNKDKKKLDAKTEMSEGRSWKKGRAERDGKGALEAAKKMKKASKSKAKSKGVLGPKKGAGVKKRRLDLRTLFGINPPSYETLAPLKRFGFLRPAPHHGSSLLRYLFPHQVRQRYRERLLDFHLDTLPHFKARLQSRIYRFLLSREHKRRERTRLVDVVARTGRRVLLGPEPRGRRLVRRALGGKDASGRVLEAVKKLQQSNGKMTSRYDYATGVGYGAGAGAVPEPGGRRRKLAALAGNVYRAGAAAAAELKEQYNNTRVRGVDESDTQQITIPGSFPNVAIVTKGQEQMVLFPSYAKRHIRQFDGSRPSRPAQAQGAAQVNMRDEEYWKQEWARNEDEKAVVDVDVRGWVYLPHTGPMTRRNRVLIGLARRLSGIAAPRTQSNQTATSTHEEHERRREEERIAREAREIEKRGQVEKEAASRGGYSETPRESDSEGEGDSPYLTRTRSGKVSPMSSAPPSPTLTATQPGGLTPEELAVANANMMARLGPFLTNPLVQSPVTLFFYNDEQSQSRTVMTNDSGHFITRVALDFIPTHVRVLAVDSSLSVTEPVMIIESSGVSLISDVDDTIKRSSISMGAREIFRNTFIRDLGELTVDGVREWYNRLHDMGVSIHYCSNSPWQLFPVLASYFKIAGLPPGSIHLKQYSGMLQGIFEPVAERKKGTLEKILKDFPDRKFLLVGDSGEADLEVYTDLAVSHPGRVLAVFIRDVTTPDIAGYFDKSLAGGFQKLARSRTMQSQLDTERQRSSDDSRPPLPPRFDSAPANPEASIVEDLIDFADEPQQITPPPNERKTSVSNLDLLSRKPPPPRPAKPAALRSPPPEAAGVDRSRKSSGNTHPLAQMQNVSDQAGNLSSPMLPKRPSTSSTTPSINTLSSTSSKQAPPPPPPRRTGTNSTGDLTTKPGPRLQTRRATANSDVDFDPLPGSSYPPSGSGATTPAGGNLAPAVNKKVEIWRRRLARAHEMLDQQGVQLYTWRKGDDVIAEAEGIVKQAMEDMKRKQER